MVQYAVSVRLHHGDSGKTWRLGHAEYLECTSLDDAKAVAAKLSTYDTHSRECTVCVVLPDARYRKVYVPLSEFERVQDTLKDADMQEYYARKA